MSWRATGYYGPHANAAEMKIQASVQAGRDRVFIFIRDADYADSSSESAILLSVQQAREFAEQLLRDIAQGSVQ